ncbi:MAG: hypothetical protein HY902_01735 [Deltaproteobacteria bacterium]|nr:hypothetical protein [Deltaproteobacteria bacterium]
MKVQSAWAVLVLAWAAACSSTPSNSAGFGANDSGGSAATDGQSGDAGAQADVATDSVDTAGADASAEDAASDVATPDDAIDWDLLDPEDTGTADAAASDTAPAPQGLGAIYAHSSAVLYKLDKNVFTKIGTFNFDKSFGEVTDIALDDNGNLFAVTFNDVFSCDKNTAKCQHLASLPQSFNGLTFVPKDTAKTGVPALIGIANSGDWNLIEVAGGKAKVSKLGSYGGYSSSGDAFSVEGVGTYATVKAGLFGSDKLVQVSPADGKVMKVVGDTGVSDLWGVAWSGGTLYGFSSAGGVYSLDMLTGKASTVPGLVVPSGVSWWGAGVSTRAAAE